MILRTTARTEITGELSDVVYGWGVAFWLVVLGLSLLVLVASIAIAKKAGYSGWWGTLFALVWPISWLLFGLFTVFKWPVLKERDEALRVLKDNNLVTPSQERVAAQAAKDNAALMGAEPAVQPDAKPKSDSTAQPVDDEK